MVMESLVSFVSGGYYGGTIGDFLQQMEQLGFFSYLLPFLLIFALVFGILEKMKIFKDNRAINGIIAFVVGLMALQFQMVSIFFAEVFPRLGVGLSIILVVLIMLGLFTPHNKPAITYAFLGVAAIVTVVILIQSGGYFGSEVGIWFYDNWPTVAVVVVFIAVIGMIVGSNEKNPATPATILTKALGTD